MYAAIITVITIFSGLFILYLIVYGLWEKHKERAKERERLATLENEMGMLFGMLCGATVVAAITTLKR